MIIKDHLSFQQTDSREKDFLKLQMIFISISQIPLHRQGHCLSFEQTWNPSIQEHFVPSLICSIETFFWFFFFVIISLRVWPFYLNKPGSHFPKYAL